MKNKFLLIPITMLLGSTLVGCQIYKLREVQPYYLDYWLDEAEHRKESDPNRPLGSLTIDEDHYYWFNDGKLTFRDKIREVIKPLSLTPNQVEKEIYNENGKYVLYKITAHLADFDSCVMYISDDGIISTNAYAGGWGAPKEQHYTYDIGIEAAKEIIDFAIASYIPE